MTSRRAGDQISNETKLVSDSVLAAGATGGHDRLKEAPFVCNKVLSHRTHVVGEQYCCIQCDGQPRAYGNDAEGR